MSHLRPVLRDVLEIFGVGGELAEELPMAFDRAELFFGGGFLFARTRQGVLAKHAGNGVVAARQDELPLQTLGAKAGLLAQFDDLAFQAAGDLVGRASGSAAEF